eukprot:8771620-Alexandrium_andersonii.AAC.1
MATGRGGRQSPPLDSRKRCEKPGGLNEDRQIPVETGATPTAKAPQNMGGGPKRSKATALT